MLSRRGLLYFAVCGCPSQRLSADRYDTGLHVRARKVRQNCSFTKIFCCFLNDVSAMLRHNTVSLLAPPLRLAAAQKRTNSARHGDALRYLLRNGPKALEPLGLLSGAPKPPTLPPSTLQLWHASAARWHLH